MALGRTYTVSSGVVTLGSGTHSALLWGWPTQGTGVAGIIAADIEAVRVSILGVTTFPSNASVTFDLSRVTGTIAGGASVTGTPHNSTDIASNLTWFSASTTISTEPTYGVTLWQQTIPFTAGANWAEWVTPGAEWRIPPTSTAGTGIALSMIQSSPGSSTQFECELVYSE
jgi:hypothetical protein